MPLTNRRIALSAILAIAAPALADPCDHRAERSPDFDLQGCACDCVQPALPLRTTRPLDRAASRALAQSNANRGASLEDGSNIDILVFYTPQVTANQGTQANVEALIDAAMLELNTALTNSLVATQCTLVDAQEIAFVEGTQLGTALARLREPDDGFIDQVHDIRDQLMADIVILITAPGDVCGVANIAMQPGLTPFPENAFGVVVDSCATGPVSAFAHEVGHIMGLRHDWGDNPCTDGGADEGKGYVEPGESWRTIMATSAPAAPRILHFANPNVDFAGVPTGQDTMSPEPADAAAALNAAAPFVAKFRDKDCNANGILDTFDIANLTLDDCNANNIPDICEPDFNNNGIADECDITNMTSSDADLDGVPDEVEQPVIYVDQSATGANSGLSWTDAFTDLQDALALARASGDITEIWIATGTYRPSTNAQRARSFRLVGGTALIGGFIGTESMKSQRGASTPNPILSGDTLANDGPDFANREDNTINIAYTFDDPGSITLERLIFEGGNADKEVNCGGFKYTGSGLFGIFTDIVVRECEFRDNLSNRGAISINDGATMQVIDSHFHSNESRDVLGLFQSGTLPVKGSAAAADFSTDFAGIDNLFAGNLVENNTAQRGTSGAIFVGGQPAVINSIFLNNTTLDTTSGGGLAMVLTEDARVTNCSVVGNTSPNFTGNGTSGLTINRAHVFIDNTLIWGNRTGTGAFPFDTQQIFAGGVGGSMTLSHNIIQDWSGSLGDATNSGIDPRLGAFTFPMADLPPNSPAIDAGTNAAPDLALISTDFQGNPRYFDDPLVADTGSGAAPLVDIGAYEFQGIAFSIEDLNSPGDGLITLDESTGLRWLDLTETTSTSWDTMQTLLAPGQQYEGFRHATRAEIDQLLTNAGIDQSGWTFGNFGNVWFLTDLFGIVFDSRPSIPRWASSGVFDEVFDDPADMRHTIASVTVTFEPAAPGDAFASADGGFATDAFGGITFGHFLIAPDPAVACDGDANADNTIDVNDITFVLFRLGNPCPAPNCDGDANGDGTIDVNDITYVLFRLGNPC